METFDRKKHWEHIYKTKALHEVGWFQPTPETSLRFFNQLKVPPSAKIIDVGGGDSLLVDHLLDLGYEDVSVLDISEAAIQRAKKRLGGRADQVKWIIADIVAFRPEESYDLWHDRAAFHFLTEDRDISTYLQTAHQAICPGRHLILGTFSTQGPRKCSGLEIKQYSESTMTGRLQPFFEKINCITVDHQTPGGTIQNFLFCSFQRRKEAS